ncbi:FHA domain-containing protein [Nocardioides immobilis]|uniref:FHA domain-containing protein n=1 Tax=Nocardioides immobilis TaxID=2049295 RepID=UPI0015F7C9D0|nr:FHA domain-containing protein [Nocardioides immobilis]
MAELSTGYTCVNPDCDIVFNVDPGDCICGATSFVRVGEKVRTPPPPPPPVRHCVRPDCGQALPDGAGACPYCGTPVDAEVAPTVDPAVEPAPPGGLALVAADGTRITLREGEEVILGRDPGQSPWARLTEGSPGVSRRHASITIWRGDLHVRDLGSSNGTWVNGIRIAGAAELPVTDGIRIGLGRRFEMEVRSS